jgi:hypothetical protein
MGVLRVDVLGAKNLVGADRSGKSDASINLLNRADPSHTSSLLSTGIECSNPRPRKSRLSGRQFADARTLSPLWNETFEAMIPSRVSSKFLFEIMDWDRVGTATPLGSGAIDLASIEPFEQSNLDLPVVPPKGGKEGSLQLKLMFQPESELQWGFGS